MEKITPIQWIALGLSLTIVMVSVVPIFTQAGIERHFSNTADADKLVIMSYNIQQAFNSEGVLDFDLITATISQENPDIIGFQESLPSRQVSGNVNPLYQIAKNLGYYIYSGAGPQFQTPGVSILSKFPILQYDMILFSSQNLPRTGSHISIEVNNQVIDFYSVHLGLFSEADRLTQTSELLDFIAETSTEPNSFRIVVGDFNAHPNSSVYQLMLEGNAGDTGYVDAWTATGQLLNASSGFTFDSYDPYQTIDYIFVSAAPAITVNSMEVITGQYGSDHLPIVAEIELT